MSHYITNSYGDRTLNRSGMNPLNMEIYEALDAFEHYMGMSGSGECKSIHAITFRKALEYLMKNPELEQEIEFVKECIEGAGQDGWVTVCFG